tara:strand:- start:4499 stop:5356 length:858 start_codon:yes stop_codon:yes gene_type:complete
MKIVVTGANGQLGRCLQDVLSQRGIVYVALGSADLNIVDSQAVERALAEHNPCVVVNAAAYTAVDKAESEEAQAYDVNCRGAKNLADACADMGIRLIHVSTDYVFDGTKGSPYQEVDVTNPLGVYGRSKRDGELAVLDSGAGVVVRTSWVFSEYGNNFLKTMIRVGKERDSLGVVNDQVGAPTYAGDLAVALVALAERPEVVGVYHFSGGAPCTWYDFAIAIFRAYQHTHPDFSCPDVNPIESSAYPTPVKRPAYSVLSGERMVRELGIDAGDWGKALGRVCSLL